MTQGTIYAHLYENARTGLARNLFWNLAITLADRTDRIESVQCEWLTFGARTWTDLGGLSLADCCNSELVECSYYRDNEHHWARLGALAFAAGRPLETLAVSLSAGAQTGGSRADLNLECPVAFEGFIVVPANLSPAPATPEEARRALEPYVDTKRLAKPIWDRFRYVFRPVEPHTA